MIRSASSSLSRSIGTSIRRGFSSSVDQPEKIVAAVLFERLPVVVPKIDPAVYAFHEFSFRWRQQYRRKYPDEFLEKSGSSVAKRLDEIGSLSLFLLFQREYHELKEIENPFLCATNLRKVTADSYSKSNTEQFDIHFLRVVAKFLHVHQICDTEDGRLKRMFNFFISLMAFSLQPISIGLVQLRKEIPFASLFHSPAVSSSYRGKGDYHIDYVPAPRITEADKTNDIKSLQRALDQRLYLLLYGKAYGAPDDKPTWHFPEKVYENEDTLRLCAESALKSVLGSLHHTYFVGNAPITHMVVEPKENIPHPQSFKKFFFKSQVIDANKFDISKCEDYAWVTKDELLEYFPEHASLFDKMIIHIK